MKHRRGIDLMPGLPEHEGTRFSSLNEWDVLGARCRFCGHTGLLDRHELQRKFGDRELLKMAWRLRCGRCDKQGGNSWIIQKAER